MVIPNWIHLLIENPVGYFNLIKYYECTVFYDNMGSISQKMQGWM